MKKDSSAVRIEMQAANAPKLEAVPGSPDSLESEIQGSLQRFKEKKTRLLDMEREMSSQLPKAGKEDEESTFKYNGIKSDVIEWSKVMLRQEPELKELEYMTTDTASLKKIHKALDFLDELKTKYQDIESSGLAKVRKITSQENMGVQIRNREQIELKSQEEKARKETAVMRRDLANLKRSFYKMYGMTYGEALVLPSSPKPAEGEQPKSFWGKLADKVWEKPKTDDEKKFEAVRSKTAKGDIKKIQDLDKKIESSWNDVMGQYAKEVEPVTTISPDTLREVLEEELADQPEKVDSLHKKLLEAFRQDLPEEIAEHRKHEAKESDGVKSGVFELPKAKTETLKPSVVIEKAQSQKDIPTLKLVRENTEPKEDPAEKRKLIAYEVMKIFGGGEQARAEASELFEKVQKSIQANNIQGMDPLDYVYLVAKRNQAEDPDERAKYDQKLKELDEKLAPKVESKEEKEKQVLNWTMDQLGQEVAAKKWAQYLEKMNGVKGASELVLSRINELLVKIDELKKSGEATNFENLDLIKATTLGDPKEATMAVILHAAKKEASKVNAKVEGLINETLEAIDEDLESEIRPTLRLVENEKPTPKSLREKTPSLKVSQKKPIIPAPPEFLSTAIKYRELADKPLDKSDIQEFVPNIPGLLKLVKGKKSSKEVDELLYATAEAMNLRSMADLGIKNHDKIDAETLEYIKTKEEEWLKKANKIGKKLGVEIVNGQGTGYLQQGAWELKNIANQDYEKLNVEALNLKNFETIRDELEKAHPMDEQGLSDYFVVVQNYLNNLKMEAWQASAADKVWKELDKSLGLSHAKMKKLAIGK